MSLHPLSRSADRVLKGLLDRHDRISGRLFSYWPDIVGPEIARLVTPWKIHYLKKQGYRLQVFVDSAQAPRLIHRKGIIIERIRSHLGLEIADIVFLHQSRKTISTCTTVNPFRSMHSTSPEDIGHDKNLDLFPEIKDIQDDVLKERLSRLAALVTRDQNT